MATIKTYIIFSDCLPAILSLPISITPQAQVVPGTVTNSGSLYSEI